MIRRTSIWTLRIAGAAAAIFLCLLGAALWRLSMGPVALPALTHAIETELSQARDGRPVRIDHVDLAWTGRPPALQLRARGIHLLDTQGRELSVQQQATVGVGLWPLFIGRFSLVRADISGGEISFVSKRGGALEIAFGPPGSPADIIVPPSEDTAPLAERVGKFLTGLSKAFHSVGRAGSLRSVDMHGVRLNISDEAGGGRWTARDAQIALKRERGALTLSVAARLEGAGGGVAGPAPARLDIITDTRFQAATISFAARGAKPRALLSPAMLGAFAGVDAPMNATLAIGLDRRVGVNRFEGDLTLGRGGALMAGQQFNVEGGRLRGRYDLERDELIISEVSLAGSRTRIRGEAHLAHASALLRADPAAPAAFDLSLPSATLDAPGLFSHPFDLQRVRASGQFNPDGSIQFTRLEAERGEAKLQATGRLWFARAGADNKLYPGIVLNGAIAGPLDVRSVVTLWPLKFIEGARDYLDEALPSGQLTNTSVMLNIQPRDLAAPVLPDPALRIGFDFAGAQIRFLDTMSPLVGARGRALLQGNRFNLALDQAQIDGLAVRRGALDLPRLYPRGAPLSISLEGEGEARAVVGLLMQRPIALGDRMPLDPATVGGRGAMQLTFMRPNQSDVPFEDLRFTVNGDFTDVSGVMRDNHLNVAEGRIRVSGDQRAITIAGPIKLGGSDVQATWVERIAGNPANTSRYQISGQFDAADLAALGYPANLIARGRVGVTVSGEGRGFNVDSAAVQVDLRNANAFLPRNFWTKRAGLPALARFNVSRTPEHGYALTNIDVTGAGGLSVAGQVRLFQDGRVRDGDISRFAVDGRADLAAAIQRGRDGALEIAARGPLLDGAPFLDAEEPEIAAVAPRAGAPAPRPAPMRFAIRADRLKLRGGAALANASVDLTLVGPAVQTLIVNGQAPAGKRFALALGPRADDPQGRINFSTEDAGFAWTALTGADNIIGGAARAAGTWRMGPPSVAQVDLVMSDFRVVRVAPMAQLLGSVGSLTGLVEMLNGDGIRFTSLEAPVTMNGNRLEIGQSHMSGPSLGFTASGDYDMRADNLDIDGVVVPSYGVNSLVSNIPILGNLLASRRGEGVIGMTYAVNGPAAAPRVGVNPLSALTPGILRRIFEPFANRRPTPNDTGPQARAGAPPG
ncbi:MAG: AsmA-like C-terminal region-containing protein [Hyphomonadaceae bacterium]